MGKPLSRPGCFRKSSCCLEKHGAGDGGMGGRDGAMEGGYGDGCIPQRSIYDTMCINQQIDSHHHHPGSVRRDGGGSGCNRSYSYSASGSLRVSRSPADMFDPQPHSLTPNPSFVRRLDERAIYDSLKLGDQDGDGSGCHSPGCFTRSVSPSVSSFSAPGVSLSSSKKHHHSHHHHGDSTKSRDSRHSWKVLTPPKQLECMELSRSDMIDRGGGYLNPGHYPPPGGQSSSLTSPLISPYSGSPLSSGYHTPVFFSPAKARSSQSQSLRCSPPHVIHPRHYSQTQSLRLSPPQEIRRSPYRAPLVELSAHDLEQDLRDRGMGTGAVGRNRFGSKIGPENAGGAMISKFDNGAAGLVLVDSKAGCVPRLVNEVRAESISETKLRPGVQNEKEAVTWANGCRPSIKNGTKMGSQVTTASRGRAIEGYVQPGVEIETTVMNKEGHNEGARGSDRNGRVLTKPDPEARPEKRAGPGDAVETGMESGPKMKVETEVVIETKASCRQVELTEHRTGIEGEGVSNDNVHSELGVAAESRVETKVETELKTEIEIVPTPVPESAIEGRAGIQTGTKSKTDTGLVAETQKSTNITDEGQISVRAGDKAENAPFDDKEKKPLTTDKTDSSHTDKGLRSKKSKSSKPTSRTRPGTATGLRPGVVSPRLGSGLCGLDSTGPAEGIESTWPRRIIVRKRTVRQGGALHNLPILPPLPSVISALEKRRPQALLHPHPGHFSENLLSSVTNTTLTSIIGRCSLKEPSHSESGHVGNLVGRASLKEQNLEHWRVYRDQEEPRRAKSKDNQGEQDKKKTERKEREEKTEKQEVSKEKEKMVIGETVLSRSKQEKAEEDQENGNKSEELQREKDGNIKHEEKVERKIKEKDEIQEKHEKELEDVVHNIEREEVEMEGGESGTFGEEGGMETWDAVLEMVNTLWDASFEKAGAGGGDADSCSGSLQRWPLLRPPVGFGGSHPPSSAASELSLTELERRARELDTDLEHLDLSQPTRDTPDLYQTLLEQQRERGDMYQTHPGPQREKAAGLIGVGSRSQVSLELTAVALPATEKDEAPVTWSTKPAAGTSTSVSSAKEDSSPDSNLTLESDSSGVFLSLSNQSQEEAGSDSDQPGSGSDLGSSSTSLEKDGEEGGLKEWGREESAELQWCYPSLLETSPHEDTEGNSKREEEGIGKMGGGEEEREQDGYGRRDGKTVGIGSIIKTPLDHTDVEGSFTAEIPQREEIPARKKVTLMGIHSSLSLSPTTQPIKQLLNPNQPIRSSRLDCGDVDPYVHSDSFVYLAVSARPTSHGEITSMTDVTTQETKHGVTEKHPEWTRAEEEARPTHLTPQKREEGDFLCTDSFVYLAAPACLLLDPTGTAPYSGRQVTSHVLVNPEKFYT
ncbi:hypothetical protein LDENG_00042500 [Lucifuga dentata]|nr:hypothetical protein LDENG_00042500 [Lucifuga dentata]